MNRRYDLATDAADYPPWEGPPHRSLLICTEQRSGSTLLGEALYFAGGLGCALEYFSSGFRPSFALDWNAPDIDRYLAALYRRRTDPSGVLSVKLFWGDIEDLAQDIAPDILDNQPMNDPARVGDDVYRRLFALLQPILPSPIHVALTRRDRIAQALSNVTAASTRKWRKLERQPATPATDSTYDFDATVQWLGHIDHANAHWRRYFAANAIVPLRVEYEDLADRYDETVRALLDALGRGDAAVPPPRLRKQAGAESAALRERFTADFRARIVGGQG